MSIVSLIGALLVQITSHVGAVLTQPHRPAYKESTAPDSLPLQDALKWLAQNYANDRVCLALDDSASGGLGNYLGYFNTALNFGLQNNVRVIFPKIDPPGHENTIGTSMETMFGQERSCSGSVTAYDLRCDLSLPDTTDISYAWSHAHKRCGASQFVADLAHPVERPSDVCDCEHVLVLPAGTIRYSFDYSRTSQVLSNHYWRAQMQTQKHELPGNLQTCARNVVAHVRLGGVDRDDCTTQPKLLRDALNRTSQTIETLRPGLANRSSVDLAQTALRANREDTEDESTKHSKHSKHICPEWYMVVLRAVVRALPDNCTCVTIVSDGDVSHPDIEAIMSNLTSSDFPRLQVLGSEVSEDLAFEALTHSDVMVVGSSGFSRLAAILARNTTAVVGPVVPSHPLDHLMSVSQLSPASGLDLRKEVFEKLQRNPAFQSLESACQASRG